MDLEMFILSEISENDKYHDIIYMWNLKKCTNKLNYKTEIFTDIENKRVVTNGDSGGCRER